MVLWVTYYCLWCFSSHHGYPALGKHAHLPRWKLGPVRSQKQVQRPIYIYIYIYICVCVTYITAINDCKMQKAPNIWDLPILNMLSSLVVFVGHPLFSSHSYLIIFEYCRFGAERWGVFCCMAIFQGFPWPVDSGQNGSNRWVAKIPIQVL